MRCSGVEWRCSNWESAEVHGFTPVIYPLPPTLLVLCLRPARTRPLLAASLRRASPPAQALAFSSGHQPPAGRHACQAKAAIPTSRHKVARALLLTWQRRRLPAILLAAPVQPPTRAQLQMRALRLFSLAATRQAQIHQRRRCSRRRSRRPCTPSPTSTLLRQRGAPLRAMGWPVSLCRPWGCCCGVLPC